MSQWRSVKVKGIVPPWGSQIFSITCLNKISGKDVKWHEMSKWHRKNRCPKKMDICGLWRFQRFFFFRCGKVPWSQRPWVLQRAWQLANYKRPVKKYPMHTGVSFLFGGSCSESKNTMLREDGRLTFPAFLLRIWNKNCCTWHHDSDFALPMTAIGRLIGFPHARQSNSKSMRMIISTSKKISGFWKKEGSLNFSNYLQGLYLQDIFVSWSGY